MGVTSFFSLGSQITLDKSYLDSPKMFNIYKLTVYTEPECLHFLVCSA